jgi:DNA-binding XRE family transcriptional regulator
MTNRDGEQRPVELDDLLERGRAANRLPPPWRRRQIRETARVSQREFAAALGVQVMTLNRWERGLACPRGRNAASYSVALARLEEASTPERDAVA